MRKFYKGKFSFLCFLFGTAVLCQAQTGVLFDAAQTDGALRSAADRTALNEAVANCQVQATKVLVDRLWDLQADDLRGLAEFVSQCPSNVRSSLYHILAPRPRETDPWSLQFATAHHQISVISLLIEMGVDVNAQGSAGNRALDIACLAGDASIGGLLLEHAADPNLRNNLGATPLHDAALNGHKGLIEMLLAHGASIDAIASSDGSTPLHYAASLDRLEAVRALVEHGADVTLKNAKGLTAIQLAQRYAFADVSELLSSKTPSEH